jgi:hypothetical protein
MRTCRSDNEWRDQQQRREENQRDDACSPGDRKMQMPGNRRVRDRV